jgi:hypothetical protein
MDAIYDIFERRPAGAMWVESFVGLHGITDRLNHLYSQRSGKYFVYNVHHAKIVGEFPRDTNTGLPAAAPAPVERAAPSHPGEVSGTNGNGGDSAATQRCKLRTDLVG